MKKQPKFTNHNVTNDISMNDFLVHRKGITTICLPKEKHVTVGQIVKLENPYKNNADKYKILKKTKQLHNIVEYKVKTL